jgi:hypothetical protein
MADAMSEHEAAQAYGTITIVGGGCYGSFYLRQLGRARSVGALTWRQVVVVDKDPACRAAGLLREGVAPDAMLAVSEWTPYFRTYLDAASEGADVARDGIVPSPLMPHLMYEWLHDRAVARWPDRTVTTQPLPAAPPTPWERAAPNGIHYVSFATWMCPINCIEPATCPHTRGPRTWTMPAAAREFAETERLAGPALFHVTHRAYGVGMFDTRDVVAADALVRVAAQDGPAAVLVGTVSHCHGALAVLSISAPVTALR